MWQGGRWLYQDWRGEYQARRKVFQRWKLEKFWPEHMLHQVGAIGMKPQGRQGTETVRSPPRGGRWALSAGLCQSPAWSQVGAPDLFSVLLYIHPAIISTLICIPRDESLRFYPLSLLPSSFDKRETPSGNQSWRGVKLASHLLFFRMVFISPSCCRCCLLTT